MSGLLDGDGIKNMFNSVLSSIYGKGVLIRTTMVRQSGGVMVPVDQPPVAVRVQIDRCTEAMRQAQGYTEKDVRMLVLQAGVPGQMITSNDKIVARGQTWKLYEIYEDPARVYWGGRAVRQGD